MHTYSENMTVQEILRHIKSDPCNIEKTYIILGAPGPTGKTWLTDRLTEDGYRAFEISEDIGELVLYRDDKNHYISDYFSKVVTIVLNRSLERPWPKKNPYI
jgi:predicted transcriptional regulator with HTH domain